MGYARSGVGPRPEQDDDSKKHAKVERSHRLDAERKTAAPRACRIAVQRLPHARPSSNQIEQKQHAPNKTAAIPALSHMAFTFLKKLWMISNMHTPPRFSSIHLTNQDSVSPIAVQGCGTALLGRVGRGSGNSLRKRSCETGAAGLVGLNR